VTLPPNIAAAGRPRILEPTTRKDRHHEQRKSSKRCYGWVLERDFAWAARFRRLARDYERLPAVLAGLHFVAFAGLMLHQWIHLCLSP
jgi:transposase